jgi:TRAP transporter 4TM/12TM fusion protein
MAGPSPPIPDVSPEEIEKTIESVEFAGRRQSPRLARAVGLIAVTWSLFQLWIASPLPFMLNFGIIIDVPARAIHLAFGLGLCFLVFPAARRHAARPFPPADLALAVIAASATLYLVFAYPWIVERDGSLLVLGLGADGGEGGFPVEAVIGGIGMVMLLEATRRALGWPLVIVAGVFLIYSVFGQSMPDLISHKGVSLTRLVGYHWFGGEAIFGIPIDVSVSFVFMFVLFGAMLERAGAGRYFLDLSFAMVGRYRGGPAKAAILASGMTGMISGSSIANVVTTGTFTIPVMRRMGMPAVKAGAIEVAASVNGQIMPPIMGAAAFVIAEFLGITYFDVVKAAFLPAFIAYIALFYISHLEALKLGLRGMSRADIPVLGRTFIGGVHFLLPIALLVYLLMVERWTPSSSVFYAILAMMVIMVVRLFCIRRAAETTIPAALMAGLADIYSALITGARNMVNISVAVAAAGIIVGSVSSTGLNNALVGVVETVSGGNIYILLGMTSLLCLILGLGLPTTANYLVVASLLAGVVVEIASASGIVFPLIAVHLYVFYFGLMADVTPPVGLAAFAAAAISRADPIRTGIQAFTYEIRTAILPVVFIFNTELLLIGVESFWHGLMVFVVSLIAILSFSAITQGWMMVRLRWYEIVGLAFVVVSLFRPSLVLDLFSPAFRTVAPEVYMAGGVEAPPGRLVRFHVVRETNYGPRYKLFALKVPRYSRVGASATGVMVGKSGGRYVVSATMPGTAAATSGIKPGDIVTEMDVEQIGRPNKRIIYPVGLAVLGLVIGLQLARRRREVA